MPVSLVPSQASEPYLAAAENIPLQGNTFTDADVLNLKKALFLLEQLYPEFEVPSKSVDGVDAVEDKDVKALEDRIAALEDRSILRLEVLIAKIDGKFDRIDTGLAGLTKAISNIEAQGRDTRTVVIGTGVAVLFGVLTVVIGMLAFGQAGFSQGVSMRDVVKAVVGEAAQQRQTTTPPH